MPNLALEIAEDEDTAVEEPTVFDILNTAYQLYHTMAGDPFFDDLATDVAGLINEVEDRRALAAKVAEEANSGLPNLTFH